MGTINLGKARKIIESLENNNIPSYFIDTVNIELSGETQAITNEVQKMYSDIQESIRIEEDKELDAQTGWLREWAEERKSANNPPVK
jgi:hypothetical protein